ncbi:MAG TPA: SRPBCC family protein [Candidatus Corynebacterium avicola]|uniref:SRPBCC family protein n=1 Tax=Candidatus Corynebacterium avicola TaxID=2838527 RepID=A0A9D1ULR3_9CORY|nr:SRPBCC family protein [Candidatus Corynebacterium avicola]
MAKELITASLTIKADPTAVWKAVSDLTTMGERSPQCKKMLILGGDPSEGTTTVNLNRRGPLFWPTWSKITEWTPNELLEWRIPINGSVWRYELNDNGDGTTTLTESRIVKGNTSALSRAMVTVFLGGNDTFEAELQKGIEQTLAAIATTAEESSQRV